MGGSISCLIPSSIFSCFFSLSPLPFPLGFLAFIELLRFHLRTRNHREMAGVLQGKEMALMPLCDVTRHRPLP